VIDAVDGREAAGVSCSCEPTGVAQCPRTGYLLDLHLNAAYKPRGATFGAPLSQRDAPDQSCERYDRLRHTCRAAQRSLDLLWTACQIVLAQTRTLYVMRHARHGFCAKTLAQRASPGPASPAALRCCLLLFFGCNTRTSNLSVLHSLQKGALRLSSRQQTVAGFADTFAKPS